MFTLVKKIIGALSRTERAILVGALIIFVFSGSTRFALYIQDSTAVVPANGGEFREGVIGQPVFINPAIPATEVDRDIAKLIFSSVTDIAQSIKRSDDGKTWNVRLEEDIFWHDGERLTADDVVFTIETIQDPESRSPLYASFQGVAAERISELEVQLVLQNPYAFFEEDHLQNLGIIPQHIFSEIPVQNFKLSIYGLKPIGSGPYRIKQSTLQEGAPYASDSKGVITSFFLEKNKSYFEEEPHISKFVFKFYRDTAELAHAYNTGQIDGFGLTSSHSLEPIKIRHRIEYLKSARYYALFLNQSLGPKELKSGKVREALTATVDRNRIVRDLFNGHATLLYGPTPLSSNPVEQYDATVLQGLELTIVSPEEPFLAQTAAIIKENWESAGAIVALRTLSLKKIQDEVLRNTDYEMLLFGNIIKESQDLFSFWHSSRRFFPDQNLALYQNKKTDKLLEDYRKNFDVDERKLILQKISDTIASDIPAIFLYSPDYVYTHAPALGGLSTDITINTTADRFANIEQWYVKTKRVFGQNSRASAGRDTEVRPPITGGESGASGKATSTEEE